MKQLFANTQWNPLTAGRDVFLIQGLRVPGVYEFRNLASRQEYQERRGDLLDGAVLMYMGTRLTEFSVVIRLYTEEDWAGWYDLQAVLGRPEPFKRRPSVPVATDPEVPTEKTSLALQVDHPILAFHKIWSAVVLSVAGPSHEGSGVYSFELQMKEQRKPRPVAASPVGGVRQGRQLSPNEQRIRDLEATNNKLAQEAAAARDELFGAKDRADKR